LSDPQTLIFEEDLDDIDIKSLELRIVSAGVLGIPTYLSFGTRNIKYYVWEPSSINGCPGSG